MISSQHSNYKRDKTEPFEVAYSVAAVLRDFKDMVFAFLRIVSRFLEKCLV